MNKIEKLIDDIFKDLEEMRKDYDVTMVIDKELKVLNELARTRFLLKGRTLRDSKARP